MKARNESTFLCGHQYAFSRTSDSTFSSSSSSRSSSSSSSSSRIALTIDPMLQINLNNSVVGPFFGRKVYLSLPKRMGILLTSMSSSNVVCVYCLWQFLPTSVSSVVHDKNVR